MPNVYDFDETIVYPNAGVTFINFCMRRHHRLRWYLPRMGREALRHRFSSSRGKPFQAELYCFLRGLPNWEEEVQLFWELHAEKMLLPWYLAQKRPDDIIISDSGDFLLQPMCEQLGVRLIATCVDPKRGRLTGPDCYGPEKVRRLREEFGDVEIEDFYSDSLVDTPLAKLAKRAFIVKKGVCTPWPKEALLA